MVYLIDYQKIRTWCVYLLRASCVLVWGGMCTCQGYCVSLAGEFRVSNVGDPSTICGKLVSIPGALRVLIGGGCPFCGLCGSKVKVFFTNCSSVLCGGCCQMLLILIKELITRRLQNRLWKQINVYLSWGVSNQGNILLGVYPKWVFQRKNPPKRTHATL